MVGAIIGILIALVVIGCIIASLFVRRHRESTSPQPGWQWTDEVFNDPSTNRVMRVWLDQTGERHYVVDGDRPTI